MLGKLSVERGIARWQTCIMSKNTQGVRRRRAARTEKRRVMQKRRKAEQRAARQTHAAHAEETIQLTPEFLAQVPAPVKKRAIDRAVRLLKHASNLTALPPGYSVTPAGPVWQLIAPASLGRWKSLVGMILHPAPELAAAFAWELENGTIDLEDAEREALQVLEELATDHALMRKAPAKKLLTLSLTFELATGYQLLGTEAARDPTLVDRLDI